MTSQIFKQPIPNELVYDFLNNNAMMHDQTYIFNPNMFKKAMYNCRISVFVNSCRPYYHLSKQKYLNKANTFNSFMTLIRQICNYNKIAYTSKVQYDKSNYDIVYTFINAR